MTVAATFPSGTDAYLAAFNRGSEGNVTGGSPL